MDALRRIRVTLEGVFVPTAVRVNGAPVCYARFPEDTPDKACWTYVGKDLAVVVCLPESAAGQTFSVECDYDAPAEGTALLRGKKGLLHRMMTLTPAMKDMFNTNVDAYKLLSRPFLKVAQCASHIESDPEHLVQYLKDIRFETVDEDLRREADSVKETEKDAEKAAAKRANVLRFLSIINAQSRL